MRFNQFSDRVEHYRKLLVMLGKLAFQRLKFRCQLLVGGQEFSQLGKRAHDLDIDLDGALVVQHAGKHGHSLLGENIGQEASHVFAGRYRILRYQKICLPVIKLEQEVAGESAHVSFHLFSQANRFYAV